MILLSACSNLFGGKEEPVPPVILEPPPAAAYETVASLNSAQVPPRDLADLTRRLKNMADIPAGASLQPVISREGDTTSFWYKDHQTNENIEVTAVLALQSESLNFWLEAGTEVNDAELNQAAAVLEDNILPTNRAFFGPEPQPGIDGDPRIHILHLNKIGGSVAGYFSQADGFVTAVNPYSNQREILYISLEHAPVGSDAYYGVIAHELQHMIHGVTDTNEATWLNEGLSELAAHLNGYTSTGFIEQYSERPDTQLNDFDYQEEATAAHYGAAFLFTTYFLERFGEAATRALVRHPENGPVSVAATLSELETGLTFDEFFAGWLAANYLDGLPNTADIYQYEQVEIPDLELAQTISRYPTSGTAGVNQYGADYLEIRGREPVTLIFTGTRQVSLMDTTAHSGSMFWSSYPADNSDVTLTRRFDLSELDSATLTYWTWYELEEGWDYAYLVVSDDEGQSWQLLETPLTTRDNPQGNSYGPGYTGISGGGEEPVWVQETVDLSAFSGRPILVRFEVVTDDAVYWQGFALDDLAVPELDFLDDVETEQADWQAAGFVRHANILPQSFLLQLLLLGKDSVEVRPLVLEDGWRGRWVVPLDENTEKAVLIVSGTTPVTRRPAGYAYQFIKSAPDR